VAQVPGSGFESKSLRRIGRFLSTLGWTSAVALSLVHGQATSAPRRNSAHKDNAPVSAGNPETPATIPAASIAPATAEAPPAAPPTAEQTPPQPPAVNWDSNLLTIDAESSTLADILAAVRTRTRASIEIPLSASRERVFVHLGPGPVREIISSLLYGTGFDYIVETFENDPDMLRSVVLTARGNGADSDVGSVADLSGAVPRDSGAGLGATASRGSISQGIAPRDGMRMMRGWAAPGKPTFQADAEAKIAAEEAARESNSASDTANANAQNQPAAGTESASGGQEAGTSDGESASSAAPSRANANSITESDIPPKTASSASSPSDSSDQTGISQSIQNMTRMFEQRRLIQAQQNRAGQPQQQSPAN